MLVQGALGGTTLAAAQPGRLPRHQGRFRRLSRRANDKLMIRGVMSFVCSDSCETGITKENVCTKGSGKLPFSDYLGFQSNGLEFLKCQILA